MTHRLEIAFTQTEGAVVRLLGLIERRGFEFDRLRMDRPDRLSLRLTARDASRRIETLSAQIRRIHGVTDVTAQKDPTPQETGT